MTIPKPPTITSHANLFTQHKFDEIYAAALTGSISAVEAVRTNPASHNTYCKKQHAYKLAVIAAMGQKPGTDWRQLVNDALDHGAKLFLHGPFGDYQVIRVRDEMAETNSGKEFRVAGRWLEEIIKQANTWKGAVAV